MSNITISPIELCPINFKRFGELNRIVGNLEESLLLAKIKFHLNHTKLKKHGLPTIARSRQDIQGWFGLSMRKTDALLSSLSKKRFLSKTIGTFFGKKKLFLSVSDKISSTPINVSLLEFLIQETGSLKSALLFSRIAFGINNSKIQIKGLSYFYIRKEELTSWLEVSIRSVDHLIEGLSRKGLVLKKNIVRNGKRITHFHVPQSSINVLKKKFAASSNSKKELSKVNSRISNKKNSQPYKKTMLQNLPVGTGKNATIHKNKNKTTVKNNITTALSTTKGRGLKERKTYEGDINFSSLEKELSSRQRKYLSSALDRTIGLFGLKISNPDELLSQLIFFLRAPEQRIGVKSFEHGVNRAMKIIADGNWKTPIGFQNHDQKGRGIKQAQQQKQKIWEQEKLGLMKTDIAKSILDREQRSKKESLTDSAIALIKGLSSISKLQGEKGACDLFEGQIKKIKELLAMGADRATVQSYLGQG